MLATGWAAPPQELYNGTNSKKTLVLGLIACLATLSTPTSDTDTYEDAQTDKMLQPQGLDHVGIYALRQIDPSLTGAGVKFAVICRSFNYNGGTDCEA